MGRKLRMLLAVAGGAVFVLGAVQGSAYAASSPGRAAVRIEVERQAAARHEVQPAGQVTAAACNGVPVEAYGYVGCARSGTHAQGCPWEEWFVIAPDRTIWHAWPNSGGWKLMPNNGRADDTHNCYWNGRGQRQVEVEVWASNTVWYSYYSGGWRGWYLY